MQADIKGPRPVTCGYFLREPLEPFLDEGELLFDFFFENRLMHFPSRKIY